MWVVLRWFGDFPADDRVVSNDSQAEQRSREGEENISVTDALYSVVKPLFMALVDDINRAQVYAASETRGMPVEHVYLTNLVANWRGIENFVDSLIDVPVSVLVPFAGFGNPRSLNTDVDPRGALVAGMALHGMTEAG
jgi:Tfp pilus assembly PilM family ATPase